jgi:predicted nucleic acid-binding protein
MRRVFADSYYFFAFVSKDEPQHQKAVEFSKEFQGELITTGWVLTEVADGLAKPPWRAGFARLYDRLLSNPGVRIEACSDELLHAGIDHYRRRLDKSWSLTDCISFVVMQREGISDALTGDHDFEQAGFVALLK